MSTTTATDRIDVAYVAHLARLHLTPAETALFQTQLEEVVAYVRKIGELDLAGIEPTSHAQPIVNVLRPDVVEEGLPHDVVMANAPQHKAGQFLVPKIVE